MPHRAALRLAKGGILLGLAAWAVVACLPFAPSETPPDSREPQSHPGELPETARECLSLAARLAHEGASTAELRLALRAVERAETIDGATPELWIHQLRILFLLAEPQSSDMKIMPWLNRGDQLAKQLVTQEPERVEGHYYRAVFLGFRAQLQEVGGMDLLPHIVEAGQKAVELDPAYDDAGPLMLMGMVLVRAPAWPHGIGDQEEGLTMLHRGVKLSAYPLNRLVLAKALFASQQTAAGCRELAKVLAAPRRGRWAKTGLRHRREARLLTSTQRCSQARRH